MKIQCNCGAKYAFDVTPDLAANPIKLVCPTCGLDLSDYINQLVQKELAENPPPVPRPVPVPVPIPAQPIAVAPAPASTLGTQLVAPPSSGSRLRIGTHKESTAEAPTAVAASTGPTICLRHGIQSVEHCAVCGKAICPKCMEEFGYVCSAFCRNKAQNKNIDIPVFEGQKNVAEARYWRKIGLIAGSIGAAVLLLVGVWTWYSWVGSQPHVKYSAAFPPASSGESALLEKNQLIILHGNTLARHDVGKKKEIWSRSVGTSHDEKSSGDDEDDEDSFSSYFADRPHLRVRGHNLWVEFPNKVVRYDWDTGSPAQEIANKDKYGDVVAHGDEIQLIGFEPKKYSVTHINLVNADTHIDEVNAVATPALTLTSEGKDVKISGVPNKAASTFGSLMEHGFDPTSIEQHIQSLPLPARIALPAVLAVSYSESRAMDEMAEEDGTAPKRNGQQPTLKERISFIPAGASQLQVRIRLVEKNIVTRSAMKAAPKKSALDGAVNQAATAAIANEIFNEMQRDKGLDVVYENESRYHLTLHRLDLTNTPDWNGDLIGPPSVFPLDTVNVVAANKTVFVFDKMNKLLWGVTNTFNMAGDNAALDPADAPGGLGPVVERDGMLYVADQGVLSAFDLTTGVARWRLPSVGVSGLVFDDQGMLYVNSTTANPDTIKYSKQIDINRNTEPLVLKIDPKTGKTLWSAKPRSYVAYASGKYLYTLQSSQGGSLPGMLGAVGGSSFETHSTVGIRRLSPNNGKIIWQYFQQRTPIDVRFDRNSIQLVFPKEVQVLRYLTF